MIDLKLNPLYLYERVRAEELVEFGEAYLSYEDVSLVVDIVEETVQDQVDQANVELDEMITVNKSSQMLRDKTRKYLQSIRHGHQEEDFYIIGYNLSKLEDLYDL